MASKKSITVAAAEAANLAQCALRSQGAQLETARTVADALVLADCDQQYSHGMIRVPSYCQQMQTRKVDGRAHAIVRPVTATAIEIDVNGGFAFPALDAAVERLIEISASQGIGIAAVSKSHHCGVAGHIVEKLARRDCIGIMFANTPKAMAPPGGVEALLGTNPIAFGCPVANAEPLVIDLSMSTVSRGRILKSATEGISVPIGWGKDRRGQDTTEPGEIIKGGTLSPFGGDKGAVLALLVEILAAAFTNSKFGYEASSYLDGEGGPPETGQFIFSAKSNLFNQNFAVRARQILDQMRTQDDVRIPGAKRFAARAAAQSSGIVYRRSLIDQITQLIS